jgi:hypothetical protein
MFRQPVDERGEHMRLDRKISIWRLDEVGSAYPAALGRKFMLIRRGSEMFDYGVTVNHVERSIRERQPPGIADYPLELAASFSLCRDIENCYPRMKRHELPVKLAAPDVEHGGVGLNLKVVVEKAHPASAETLEKSKNGFDVHGFLSFSYSRCSAAKIKIPIMR